MPEYRSIVMPKTLVASFLFFVMLVPACAERPSGEKTRSGESPPGSRRSTTPTWTGSSWPSSGLETEQRYEVRAMVVQGDGDATLCLGDIASPSLCFNSPDSVGKVPVPNWDWERVEGEELDSDVIWGQYHLFGTYDGVSFTVLEAGPSVPSTDDPGYPIEIPCPEPEGGWVATDPSRATEAALHAAGRYVDSQPDSAGYWIKYLQDDVGEASLDFNLNPYVLVTAFRSNIERHQADLAEVWGGPLCAVEYSRTEADLSQIQAEVHSPASEELGIQVLWSATDVIHNRVEIGVVVFEEEVQAALDERYGVGAVRQVPSLIPVD